MAIGLETVHPQALDKLNKRMTVETFARAAGVLAARGIALRVFLLVNPPFIATDDQEEWLMRSVDAAFDCGAAVVSLIPTRSGNGAMNALSGVGLFQPTRLADLERAFDAALTRSRGRVLADCWDLGMFIDCAACAADRHARLVRMNVTQHPAPAVRCACCGGSTGAQC